MCLVVNSPIQIAKRGILVWKIVKPIQNNEVPQWSPPIIEGTGAYRFNEILKARGISNEKLIEIENLRVVLGGGTGETYPIIKEGFHSYIKRRYYSMRLRGWRQKIAIIPKGAQYVRGAGEDIVSNWIIVFSNTWELIKYCLYGHKRKYY
jgi:hypothetical protein